MYGMAACDVCRIRYVLLFARVIICDIDRLNHSMRITRIACWATTSTPHNARATRARASLVASLPAHHRALSSVCYDIAQHLWRVRAAYRSAARRWRRAGQAAAAKGVSATWRQNGVK